jgi:hypothetical protein
VTANGAESLLYVRAPSGRRLRSRASTEGEWRASPSKLPLNLRSQVENVIAARPVGEHALGWGSAMTLTVDAFIAKWTAGAAKRAEPPRRFPIPRNRADLELPSLDPVAP